MEPINNLEYQARRALVLGTTGTGKSTLAMRLVATHQAQLVLVYDWQGAEFAERLGAKAAVSRRELAAQIENGNRLVCYAAEKGEADPTGEGFEWFCEMAFEVAGATEGRKLLVVDEVQDLIDPYNIPDGLEKCLTRGRRRMLDTCLIGDAANAIHTKGRNQVSELYCFRCTDDNALIYPASLGIEKDEIRSLPDTCFIYRDNRTGFTKKLALWKEGE